MIDINQHVHSPHSFSSFDRTADILLKAKEEGISIIGLNDFYVRDGFEEFTAEANKAGIFPLYNIEFIALSEDMQQKGIRANDPANPGRVYLCGKGLKYPTTVLPKELSDLHTRLLSGSQQQIQEMIAQLNNHLSRVGVKLSLDYAEVKKQYARDLVRERHIARALREVLMQKYANQLGEVLAKVYGTPSNVDASNVAALDNEIRNNLLKAGKPAFVPEDSSAFLSLEEVKALVEAMGGQVVYPMLLDGTGGNCTEFEANKEALLQWLRAHEIYGVELIPHRNSAACIAEYTAFFEANGVLVSYGSEHNTPDMLPLKLYSKGGHALTEKDKHLNCQSACVYASGEMYEGKNLKELQNIGRQKIEKVLCKGL